MQISASYDFIFSNDADAEKATKAIEQVLADNSIDHWIPQHYNSKVITFGEDIDWDVYEDLVIDIAKQIAIEIPDSEFSGTSNYDVLSVGSSYGIKILYKDKLLTIECGEGLLRDSSGAKFCPYCGLEYDMEDLQADIESGDIELDDEGNFMCYQCEMEITLDELTEETRSMTFKYVLSDGKFEQTL